MRRYVVGNILTEAVTFGMEAFASIPGAFQSLVFILKF
jgi:hypothetical protein